MKKPKVYTKLLKIPREISEKLDEFITLNGQGISKTYGKRSVSPMRVILYALDFALSNTKAFKAWIYYYLLKNEIEQTKDDNKNMVTKPSNKVEQ